jgi:Toprim domain-containing protein
MPDDRIDIKTIDRLLRERVGELVIHIRGQQPNRARSSRTELRFGTRGSLAVVISGRNKGRITDFEGDGKGMSPLDFIQSELRLPTRGEAVRWAKEWLGIDRGGDYSPCSTSTPEPANDVGASEHKAEAERDEDHRRAKATRISNEAVPIAGTPAELYLLSRGITVVPPSSAMGYRARAQGEYGALVVRLTDCNGALQAVQQVFITADGRKAPLTPAKRTNGMQTGCAVKLPGAANGPLIMAEGPETALSVWEAAGDLEVLAVLGTSNFAKVARAHRGVLIDREILLAADGDAPDSPAARTLRKQVAELVAEGFNIRIAPPWVVRVQRDGEWHDLEGADHNDVLQHANANTVLAALCGAQWASNDAGAPLPHYNEPSQDAEPALAAMLSTIASVLDGELLRMRAAREAKALAHAEHQAAGLVLDDLQMAMLSEAERRQLVARKAAITRRVNDEVRAHYSVADLDKGRRLQLPSPAGAGKTAGSVRAIVQRPGLSEFVIYWLVPDLGMGVELESTFQKAIAELGGGLKVKVVRGMTAPRPDAAGPDEKMCGRPDVAMAVVAAGLMVGPNICRSGDKVCPLYESCAYQAQRRTEPGVYILAHDFLSLPPPAPSPDLLIIDESFHKRMLTSARLTLDRLAAIGHMSWSEKNAGAAADYLVAAGKIADAMLAEARAAEKEVRAPKLLDAVRRAGFPDREALKPVIGYLAILADEAKPPFDPSCDAATILAAVQSYVASDIGLVKLFFRQLDAEIGRARPGANGITLEPDAHIGVGGRHKRTAMLTVYYRKRIQAGENVPILTLDASADHGINKRFCGDRLENAPARIRRNAYVVQVYGKSFSRQSITGCDSSREPLSDAKLAEAQRLQAEVVEFINALPGDIAVMMNKPVEELLSPRLRDGVYTGHFGALRGRNEWQRCNTIVVVGRDQPRAYAVEQEARSLCFDDDEPLQITGEYVLEPRRLRLTGNRPPVISEVRVHPDRRVQALLETYREREVEQAIDRARLIHNKLHKTVYVLNDLALDIDVDMVVSWPDLRGGGNRYIRAWADTGILPNGAADLHRVHPSLWSSVKAAKGYLDRHPISTPNFPTIDTVGKAGVLVCSYRRQGQRGSPSTAFICPRRHPDPPAALEAALGELADFRVVEGAPAPATVPPQPQRVETSPQERTTEPDLSTKFTGATDTEGQGGSWREARPDEVFQPGGRYRMDQATGKTYVDEPSSKAKEAMGRAPFPEQPEEPHPGRRFSVNPTQSEAPPAQPSPAPADPAVSLSAWTAGVARLTELSPPPQWPADRWKQLVIDAAAFLATWGKPAAALGWTTFELFGAHRRASYARLDALGLVGLLNGNPVTELTAERAVIRAPSGAALVYRRKPSSWWPREAERALIWDAALQSDL